MNRIIFLPNHFFRLLNIKYLCYIFLFFNFLSYAQNNNSLRLKFLITRITIGAKSDSDKVVKINRWITRHIKYDVKGLIHHRLTRWSVRKILRRRKGLCKEYAFLFDAMCKQAGITSLTINGYSKSSFTDEDDIFLQKIIVGTHLRLMENGT